MSATNLKFTVDDQEYIWFGGFGAIFLSCEKGVKKGTLRKIGERIYFAYLVKTDGWIIKKTPEISWSLADGKFTADDIRVIKEEFFSVQLSYNR